MDDAAVERSIRGVPPIGALVREGLDEVVERVIVVGRGVEEEDVEEERSGSGETLIRK